MIGQGWGWLYFNNSIFQCDIQAEIKGKIIMWRKMSKTIETCDEKSWNFDGVCVTIVLQQTRRGKISDKVVRQLKKEFCKMMSTKKFRLEYYMVENQIETDSILVTTYGVEIMKKQRKNGVVLTETKTVKNVCISAEQIRRLIDLLAQNLVTPVTLKDIIDDLVEEQKINTPKEQMILDNFANCKIG